MKNLLNHLEKLHAFVVITDSGSLQAAAKQLHISQPSLSQMVKKLEYAVGEQLFTRSIKGVRLTKSGKDLYHFSQKIIDQTSSFSFQTVPGKSRMRIGTYDIIAHMISDNLIKMEKLIDLSFSSESSGLAILDWLSKDRIDLAIIADPPRLRGFEYHKLSMSPYGLFCTQSIKERLIKGSKDLHTSIQQAPFIYVLNSIIHEHNSSQKNFKIKNVDSFIEQYSLGLNQVIRVDSHVLAIQLALQGKGIALLVKGHILEHIKEKSLLELPTNFKKTPMSTTLYIVTKSNDSKEELSQTINSIDKVFKDAIQDYNKL